MTSCLSITGHPPWPEHVHNGHKHRSRSTDDDNEVQTTRSMSLCPRCRAGRRSHDTLTRRRHVPADRRRRRGRRPAAATLLSQRLSAAACKIGLQAPPRDVDVLPRSLPPPAASIRSFSLLLVVARLFVLQSAHNGGPDSGFLGGRPLQAD